MEKWDARLSWNEASPDPKERTKKQLSRSPARHATVESEKKKELAMVQCVSDK